MNGSGIDRYRLRRPEGNRVIFGVCAGLSEYFGISVSLLRGAALVSLVLFFGPTALAYCTLAFLIPKGQTLTSIDDESRHFHQKLHRNPLNVLDTIEAELSTAEMRLEVLERYLTSRRFRLHEEFRSLATEPKTRPKTDKPF